jgi:chromate transporter
VPDALTVLILFARLSFLAIGGGNAAIPEMHREIVERHAWLDDATFAEAWALASAAPGPNVLVVVVLGWSLAGVPGFVGALLGFLGPASLLAWAIGGLAIRAHAHPAMAALRGGLVPIAYGLSMATGLVTAAAAANGTLLQEAVAVAITLGSAAFAWRSLRNPFWALVAGGALGLAFLR